MVISLAALAFVSKGMALAGARRRARQRGARRVGHRRSPAPRRIRRWGAALKLLAIAALLLCFLSPSGPVNAPSPARISSP